MEIRRLRLEDLEELRKLVKAVYSDSELAMWFDKMPSNEELNSLFMIKMASIANESAIDIVATEKGKIIGECEIVDSLGSHVVGLIIAKASRRKGIGKKLLLAGIKEAKKRGFLAISAEVVEDNLPGKNFFLKNGFEVVGILDKQFARDKKEHKILYLERMLS